MIAETIGALYQRGVSIDWRADFDGHHLGHRLQRRPQLAQLLGGLFERSAARKS